MPSTNVLQNALNAYGADLSTNNVATILFELFTQKFSGQADFQTDKIIRRLVFSNGLPLSAQSNLRSETTIPLLKTIEAISASELATLQSNAANAKLPLQQLLALVNKSDSELLAKIQKQLLQKRVCLLFALNKGTCKLKPAAANSQNGNMDIFRGYFDGIDNHFNYERIAKEYPALAEENAIIFNQDLSYELEGLPFIPEEKGIVTIASSSATIAEVFQSSLLEKSQVMRNLLKIYLLRILNTESPLQLQERQLNESLDDAQRRLKARVSEMIHNNRARQNYFELLNVTVDSSQAELDAHYQKLMNRCSLENIKPLFTNTSYQELENLIMTIETAYKTLSDDKRKQEYNEFLKSGKGGSFESQSITLAIDKVVREARTHFNMQKYSEAFKLFQDALKKYPKNPLIVSWLGITHFRLAKDAEKASALCKQAIQIDDSCNEAYMHLAEILHESGHTDQAKDYLSKLIQRKPDHTEALSLLKKVDPKEAVGVELQALYDSIETINYYALLGLNRDAKLNEIKTAYRVKTKQFHPDRFFTKDTGNIKEQARTIYKRVVEAYMVLRNAPKRQEYDRQLLQKQTGDSNVRLKDAKDVVQRKERSDIQIKSPQAKKFYQLAETALRTNNISGAIMNYQLALRSEPDNQLIKKRLQEATNKGKSGV